MAISGQLAALAGRWHGTNRLNLGLGDDSLKESHSMADVSLRVGGQCLEIAYSWEYEGKPQEGLLVIDGDPAKGRAEAAWTDSWHMANALMDCRGEARPDGSLNVMGHYGVEGHPDWGWRTEIVPKGDSFKYLMFNVSPEGEEEWAVETEFKRIEEKR